MNIRVYVSTKCSPEAIKISTPDAPDGVPLYLRTEYTTICPEAARLTAISRPGEQFLGVAQLDALCGMRDCETGV